jgi:hypothetical protein
MRVSRIREDDDCPICGAGDAIIYGLLEDTSDGVLGEMCAVCLLDLMIQQDFRVIAPEKKENKDE